jgi:hypothetical protein
MTKQNRKNKDHFSPTANPPENLEDLATVFAS